MKSELICGHRPRDTAATNRFKQSGLGETRAVCTAYDACRLQPGGQSELRSVDSEACSHKHDDRRTTCSARATCSAAAVAGHRAGRPRPPSSESALCTHRRKDAPSLRSEAMPLSTGCGRGSKWHASSAAGGSDVSLGLRFANTWNRPTMPGFRRMGRCARTRLELVVQSMHSDVAQSCVRGSRRIVREPMLHQCRWLIR